MALHPPISLSYIILPLPFQPSPSSSTRFSLGLTHNPFFYPSIPIHFSHSIPHSFLYLSHNHILLLTPIPFSIIFLLYVKPTPNPKSEEAKTSVLVSLRSLNHREELRLQEESKNAKNTNPSIVRRTKEPLPTVDELSPVTTICRLLMQVDADMWSSTLQHTLTINSLETSLSLM